MNAPQISKTGVMETAPRVQPSSRAEWREWLAANHASANGAWLVSWKRHTGKPTVGYEESVEEALCFGWIDGRLNKLDEERTMQWFAPRRPKGTWARSNKERVERLEAAGLMTDAGRAAIEIAKANGSWNSLDQIDDLVMPPDLEVALADAEGAREHFDSRSPSSRRTALAFVTQVKNPTLRAGRVQRVVEACVQRESLARAFGPRD
jgi:uncharacterized protein YdeI (YjbR/CyaY-like superfamily)